MKPVRELPPLFARALQAKIDSLPEDIREIVREHMADLLRPSAELKALRRARQRRAAAAVRPSN